jgi:solute carrier family 27 (fatty acid transporter), member 1/4
MAAILDPDGTLDVKNLAQGLAKVLPTYARPLFIRVVNTIDLTGTYKLRKVDYQKESFDLNRIKEDLYFFHPEFQNYVPFTAQLYEELAGGKIRV